MIGQLQLREKILVSHFTSTRESYVIPNVSSHRHDLTKSDPLTGRSNISIVKLNLQCLSGWAESFQTNCNTYPRKPDRRTSTFDCAVSEAKPVDRRCVNGSDWHVLQLAAKLQLGNIAAKLGYVCNLSQPRNSGQLVPISTVAAIQY